MAVPLLHSYPLNMDTQQPLRKRKRTFDEGPSSSKEKPNPTFSNNETTNSHSPDATNTSKPTDTPTNPRLSAKLKPMTKILTHSLPIAQVMESTSDDPDNSRMTPIAESMGQMILQPIPSPLANNPPATSPSPISDNTDAYLLHPSEVSQASRKRLRRYSSSDKSQTPALPNTASHDHAPHTSPSPTNAQQSPSPSKHQSPTKPPPPPLHTSPPSPSLSSPSPSPPSSSSNSHWWTLSEITGHDRDPSSPDDDGHGLNGIGFRPTPAMAHARRLQRHRQVSAWKAREDREARQARLERRRRGAAGIGKGEESGGVRVDGMRLGEGEGRFDFGEGMAGPPAKKAVRFAAC